MKTITTLLLSLTAIAFAEESVYENPIDGRGYVAEWKMYLPEGGEIDQSERVVQTNNIRLLSTQQDFSENLSVEVLAEFIKATQNNIEQSITTPTERFELLIETVISKEKEPQFQIASQGKVAEQQLQKIYDGLKKMNGLRSKSTDLKYQVYYTVQKKG